MKAILSLLVLLGLSIVASAQAPLRAGDPIELRISGVPAQEAVAFNGPYSVDGSGMLSLPYIGKVKAAGLTPGQVEAAIATAYKTADIYTQPTITMVLSVNAGRTVSVGGEVKAPQRVPHTADLTLLMAINAAGGFTEYANQKSVKLLRGDTAMVIDVRRIRAKPEEDVKLLPGDRIEVSQSIF